jgi:hypothetical protein
MALYSVQKEVILVKSTHFNVLNTGKYRQFLAGIGIWSPEYRCVRVAALLHGVAVSQTA